MANPRKFSEKIAMHTQKQAEETAAFDRIMQEVSRATIVQNLKIQTLSVSNKSGKSETDGPLPRFDMNAASPSQSTSHEGRGRSMGIGPMRRPSDRKVDTSPYNGNMYLSLPNDSGWRRTSSDSAIHQNFVKNYDDSSKGGLQPSSSTHSLHAASAGSRRRRTNSCKSSDTTPVVKTENALDRPKSSCDLSANYLGASPCNPHQPMSIMGNNTGSLPDLTSLHYPIPTLQYAENVPTMQYNTLSDYRTGRPSPSTSPTFYSSLSNNEEFMAPESPSSQPPFNIGNYSQPDIKDFQIGPSIHHHFEQFSLCDESYKNQNDCNNLEADSYFAQKISNVPVSNNSTSTSIDDESKLLNLESDVFRMRSNKNYAYDRDALSGMAQAARMPNATHACIPEIIFTDFSNSIENNTGILQEDPTRPIDIELGSMDFASFQMLSDASVAMIGDQNIEEHLRQDFN